MSENDRLARVRASLDEWDVDAVLIGSPANRRWLSDFTGSAGWLLVSRDEAWLATDFRYWARVAMEAPNFELYQVIGTEQTIATLLQEKAYGRVGIEAAQMSVAELESLQEKVNGSSEWVSLKETVEPLRAVKSAEELALMRRAAALGDLAVARMPELARPGVTERQLAWALEKVMRDNGADAAAFTVIVASGPNAALPHHQPGDRRLEAGDAIVVDIGADVAGYKSDLTRSYFLGAEPTAEYLEIYALVARAQENALMKMRPGMTSKEIDALARDVIRAAGHDEHFGHGLGHGVGLAVHESPRLSQYLEETTIPAGAVLTVEPGVYVPGWGGVRIEDLVVLREDGPELLSAAPKQPAIPL